jgi:hypothetical protein
MRALKEEQDGEDAAVVEVHVSQAVLSLVVRSGRPQRRVGDDRMDAQATLSASTARVQLAWEATLWVSRGRTRH